MTPPAADAPPAPPRAGRSEPDPLLAVVRNPAARNYLLVGTAALALAYFTLVQKGVDPVAGAVVVLTAEAGMVFRRMTVPVIVLLLLVWVLVFPFGLPPPNHDPLEIQAGRFRVADILLSAATVVYLAATYRVFGLTAWAMPSEHPVPARGPRGLVRRPPGSIGPGEVDRLLYAAGGVAVAAQVVWLFVTSAELDPSGTIPVRLAEEQWPYRRQAGDGPLWVTRVVVAAGLAFFATLAARLVFGYWRLRAMSPAEGGMVLQDMGWNETRREQVRVAGWRAWARRRAAGRGKAGKPFDGPVGGGV